MSLTHTRDWKNQDKKAPAVALLETGSKQFFHGTGHSSNP